MATMIPTVPTLQMLSPMERFLNGTPAEDERTRALDIYQENEAPVVEASVPGFERDDTVPDDADRGFWEACNDERLVIQNCRACDRLQHPPQPTCLHCGSTESLEWKPVSGRGSIYSYVVAYAKPFGSVNQPVNCALIQLEEDPGIQMLSHLPGTPVDEVPIDAPVEVVFQSTPATGQKVPEWRVVDRGR